MRKVMQEAVRNFIMHRENSALLLIDIGVWPFKDLLQDFPKRVKNIGIFEPGTIGIAAGLSLGGIIPTVYGITPFIVQRSLEQLKLDFVYQNIGGNFITTGAAYDFSTLGYSHYCPEDVATLLQLPGMDIITPGTVGEFGPLWDKFKENGKPSYFRLTDYAAKIHIESKPGEATILRKGKRGLVVVAAELVEIALKASEGLDVTVLYYSVISPFDADTLRKCYNGEKIFICEPFYKGTMAPQIIDALRGCSLKIENAGVPRKVLRNYGTKQEKDIYCGLGYDQLRNQIVKFFA